MNSFRPVAPPTARRSGACALARSGTFNSPAPVRRRRLTATCSMRSAPTATWPASRLPTAPSSGARTCPRISVASPVPGPMPNRRSWTVTPSSAPRRQEGYHRRPGQKDRQDDLANGPPGSRRRGLCVDDHRRDRRRQAVRALTAKRGRGRRGEDRQVPVAIWQDR